jgi:murein DD-endopeptidase MepM/ murein hydrolase activator NlpD
MRCWRTGGGRVIRALTALVVAFVATASALHLLFSETQPPASDVQEIFAGRPLADSYSEAPDTARQASPSIVITVGLDRTASVAEYLTEAGLDTHQARIWALHFRRAARTNLLRKDHALTLFKDSETGSLRGFKYDLNDRTEVFETALGAGIVKAFDDLIQYVTKPVGVTFAVHRSFRLAAQRNHLPHPIVQTLVDAFAGRYDLDRLGAGSTVRVIYDEQVSRDGTHRIPAGVQAVEIRSGGRVMQAFAFRDEHGRAHLYDGSGRALGQQFLRFPINFEYISSGFTMRRYHPILHIYRPHLGVDLVARYGTPVRAIADGRVEQAGWCGELGDCVRLKHDNRLASIYGHLSRISPAVRRGGYVRMGQVIGWVGATGLATGPHLHFGLERDGSYVNPLTQHLGVNHQISPRMRALFDRLKERYLVALAKLPHVASRLAASATGPDAVAAPTERDANLTPYLPAVSHRRLRPRSRQRVTRITRTVEPVDVGVGAM